MVVESCRTASGKDDLQQRRVCACMCICSFPHLHNNSSPYCFLYLLGEAPNRSTSLPQITPSENCLGSETEEPFSISTTQGDQPARRHEQAEWIVFEDPIWVIPIINIVNVPNFVIMLFHFCQLFTRIPFFTLCT